MEFFEAVEKRRSIRRYTEEPVADEVVEKALDAAILAPNSSNVQTWNFFWVKSKVKKDLLVKACLDQSAAKTAKHLIVVTANPSLWKRSNPRLAEWVKDSRAPKSVLVYYDKLIPLMYRWGFLNILAPFKWLFAIAIGLFRPMMRGPFTRGALQEVAIKSSALAAENFALAVTAQGYASCMMEGFDEWRVCRLLGLQRNERVVMVIAVGVEAEKGTWGPRFRLPKAEVVKII